jgi:hypothetical protein
MNSTPRTDARTRVAEVERFIDLVRRPGGVVEVRVLKVKDRRGRPYNASGYFRDARKAAAAALAYEGRQAEGIYLAVNEVNPECWARSPEQITDYQEPTTSDSDILRRWWLPIDCDPVRPAGVCASAAQVKAAGLLAAACQDFLREEYGWPDPVEATSGNGSYLLYPLDLPNDKDSADLLAAVLAAIGQRAGKVKLPAGAPAVKVDKTMFNASRIIRLIGTRNCKGHSTADQPHRQSRLIDVPSPLVPLTLEQLQAVAADAPGAQAQKNGAAKKDRAPGGDGLPRLDVGKWLQARGVRFTVKGSKDRLGRTVYLLAECPFDSSHGGHKDVAIFQAPDGQLGAGCKHDSCQGRGWQEFKEKIGKPDPDHWDPPLRPSGKAPAADPKAAAPAEPWEEPLPLGAGVEVPEFPVEVLPGWQGRWVEAVSVATQTPPDLAGLLALAIAGAGLAGKFRVLPRPGWTEPLNLMTCVALLSGERKSAVFALALAPVEEYEADEIARTAPEIAEAECAKRILEERIKELQKKAAKAANPEQRTKLAREAKDLAKDLAACRVPVPPQLFTDDVTPEQLARLLAQQGGRMLLASAEGTCFEIAKGRYSETANFDVFLKGHAGDFLRVDRVKRQGDSVARPALSCALAVQPDVITGLAEAASMRARGFLARWSYSLPGSRVGARQVAPAPVPPAVARAYEKGMLSLWATTGTVDKSSGKPAPHLLSFSTLADRLMRDFERWLEPQLADGEPLSYLAGWANKLAGAAARIAGILWVAQALETDKTAGSWGAPIPPETVAAAIRLAREYLLPHAQAAFGLMGCDPLAQDARRVVQWLAGAAGEYCESVKAGEGSVSKRDLHVGVFGGTRKVSEVDAVLDLLVRHLYLRPEPDPPGQPRRGRPASPRFQVNPAVLRFSDPP